MEERVGGGSLVHEKTCQFEDLPEEILPEIFVHLPPRDFYAIVPRVARSWRRVSDGYFHQDGRIPASLSVTLPDNPNSTTEKLEEWEAIQNISLKTRFQLVSKDGGRSCSIRYAAATIKARLGERFALLSLEERTNILDSLSAKASEFWGSRTSHPRFTITNLETLKWNTGPGVEGEHYHVAIMSPFLSPGAPKELRPSHLQLVECDLGIIAETFGKNFSSSVSQLTVGICFTPPPDCQNDQFLIPRMQSFPNISNIRFMGTRTLENGKPLANFLPQFGNLRNVTKAFYEYKDKRILFHRSENYNYIGALLRGCPSLRELGVLEIPSLAWNFPQALTVTESLEPVQNTVFPKLRVLHVDISQLIASRQIFEKVGITPFHQQLEQFGNIAKAVFPSLEEVRVLWLVPQIEKWRAGGLQELELEWETNPEDVLVKWIRSLPGNLVTFAGGGQISMAGLFERLASRKGEHGKVVVVELPMEEPLFRQ